MRGGRWSYSLCTVVFMSTTLGCGERRAGENTAFDSTPAAGPAGAPAGDTAVPVSDTTPVVGAAPAPVRDTAPVPTPPAARDTQPQQLAAAPKPAAPKPVVPKPAAPKPAAPAPQPEPPAAAAADTPPATPPAPVGDTAPASAQAVAPLRDEYHRAPLDTVSQQVYDGWKQYNLNCARCHGEDVLGSTIAPHLVTSLKPNGPINTKELFVQTVCVGRPEKGMPAWCPLGMEMDKIEAMYSYVKGRSDGKLRPGRPALRQEG